MIKEVEIFTSQTLPISYSVFGRRTNKNRRVEYLIDPKGLLDKGFGIPEQVVLSRWKKKSSRKNYCSGMRMSPNIWRSIRVALGNDAFSIAQMSIEEINACYHRKSDELKAHKYPIITGEKILHLARGLGSKNLEALLLRHNDMSRSGLFGTPDLYLWKSTKKTRDIHSIKFVEVKKPKEPLSSDQRDELEYLNNVLGIPALLLRLIEHKMTQRLNL
jgi:hypothetical protein